MKDKKRAMGRGLGAILSAESKASVHTADDAGAEQFVGNIVEIPLDDIFPNPKQPRTTFDEQALEDLATSIRALGIIQPITVRKEGERFEIISGERRYRASKLAGLEAVPAYIRLVNDQEMLEMALVENIQREDLDAIEIALTYQRLLDEIGMTQENLSQRVGKERSTITNTIRLLRLSPKLQDAIRQGVISPGHGRAIISLENEQLQHQLFDLIQAQNLNVRDTEKAAKLLKNGENPPKEKKETVLPNNLRRLQKSVEDRIGNNIEIKSSAKGDKGKIILNFSNPDELDALLELLGDA